MRIAILSPIAWRTPPKGYGPWEQVASNITEGLVRRGHDVTLFATKESRTQGRLIGTTHSGYEEDKKVNPDVWKPMHIAEVFERADEFDIIHNHFDFTPLTYSRLIKTPVVTTIHGFSSPEIHPAYEKYNRTTHFVSISNSNRLETLDYVATVYNGIDLKDFTFNANPGDNLLFLGRICYEKGTHEAIEIAKRANKQLIIAAIIQEEDYFRDKVEPRLCDQIQYIGPIGPEKRNELLGNALAFLHPVMRPEPFGLTMAESMACGTPVIGFDLGSVREVVDHNKTGFVVNSIDEAVDSVRAIPSIDRTDCRSRVERHFSLDTMVEGYVSVYEKILAKN